MSPTKENAPPCLINMENITKMTDTEFRTFMVTKFCKLEQKRDNELQEIRKSFQDMKEEMDTLRKNQEELLEIKSILQEIKNSLESIKSRLDHAEDQISDVEDKTWI